ncbi:MAG: glycosyltransferase [Bacteroidia bacterium]|nr:glycosyltransferase [Bacteroidia bacterium]NNM15284.1 glycosyltransferase [Bacteroidia bacterium]
MKALYISYDGMTDPLGQSQVMPYLFELSNCGYEITLISFEKEIVYQKNRAIIQDKLCQNNIKWVPLNYTKRPPVLSTIWDIIKLRKEVFKLYKTHNYKLVHCRSYISALVGLSCKQKYNSYFVFDMRGFWADERVDGKIWKLINPIYSLIYGYFKRKEIKFLHNADHIVVLTHEAKKIVSGWLKNYKSADNISVIPCSVNMNLFDYNHIDTKLVNEKGQSLSLQADDFVLGYIGSIGTWYMLPEMLSFFKLLKSKRPGAKFLFVTKEKKEFIIEEAINQGLGESDIIITPSELEHIPYYSSLFSASIFFIKPCFSKKASSPTKQGELMSMGIPIICNSGIGDTDLIINESDSGILINDFTTEEYEKAISKIDASLLIDKKQSREVAAKYYDLKKATDTYIQIYKEAELNQ